MVYLNGCYVFKFLKLKSDCISIEPLSFCYCLFADTIDYDGGGDGIQAKLSI